MRPPGGTVISAIASPSATPVRRPTLFQSQTSTSSVALGVRLASPSSSPGGSSPGVSPRRFPGNSTSNSATDSPPATEVRIALLGALGSGKSALVVKYITRRFIMEYDPYLEDTYVKLDVVDSRPVSSRIMDTSDTPDRKPERYLKWANAFVVVYSIVSRDSFDEATRYLDNVTKYIRLRSLDSLVFLVGNKADLERYRTVSRLSAEALAARFDCPYLETSAAEDLDSVAAVFSRVNGDVIKLRERQTSSPQSLFISEDRHKQAGSKGTTLPAETGVRETADVKGLQATPRRSASGFKLFNKGFRIFN